MNIMFRVIVDVDKRPFHVGQSFQLALERLTNIMRYLEWRLGVHDDVDLDKVPLARMVRATLTI